MSYRPYSEIIAAAVRLDNNQFMKGRNQADTFDLNIIKIGSDDSIVLDNSDGSSIVKIESSVFQLSSFASAPSPASLDAGQLYWDSTNEEIKVYDGSSWAPVGGGIAWSDPVNANIIPDTNGVRNLGSASLSFNQIYAQKCLLVDSVGDPDVYIESTSTRYTRIVTPNAPYTEQGFSDVGNAVYLGAENQEAVVVGDLVSDLIITTRSATSNTGNLYLRSGNASSTYNSGNVVIESGTVVSGTRGEISLNAKNVILQPVAGGLGSIIISTIDAWIRHYDGTIEQELIRYSSGLNTIQIGNGQSATFSGQTYFQGQMNILSSQNYNGNSSFNFVIENGPTFSRPALPVDGMVYYDTTINKVIVYNSGDWYDVLGTIV